MARRSLFGGLVTLTAAAAAAAGVCYLFKEEIRGTETYKNLNEKYDVDEKIKTYSAKAKDTASPFRGVTEPSSTIMPSGSLRRPERK